MQGALPPVCWTASWPGWPTESHGPRAPQGAHDTSPVQLPWCGWGCMFGCEPQTLALWLDQGGSLPSGGTPDGHHAGPRDGAYWGSWLEHHPRQYAEQHAGQRSGCLFPAPDSEVSGGHDDAACSGTCSVAPGNGRGLLGLGMRAKFPDGGGATELLFSIA